MTDRELPVVVVDDRGTLRFNGLTAEERLAALEAHSITSIDQDGRKAEGTQRAARREGAWRYSIGDDEQFVVNFVDDHPVSAPAGWRDADWPRPSVEHHHARREVLELILREYRRPTDIERVYRLLVPRYGNSIPVVRGLMDALDVSLSDAKIALDAACTNAKRSPR